MFTYRSLKAPAKKAPKTLVMGFGAFFTLLVEITDHL